MTRPNVLAIVEGATERNFVRQSLAPYLAERGVDLVARVVGIPGKKGGVRSFPAVRREIVKLLRERTSRVCTTMFDYYGLPTSWPGVQEGKKRPARDGVSHIEAEIERAICEEMGGDFEAARFVAYVELHEFEAMIFSDTAVLATVLLDPTLEPKLSKIVADCGEPELIDDSPVTAPSKRILTLQPRYIKPADGPTAAARMGIDVIRRKCPHFATWMAKLESLATVS